MDNLWKFVFKNDTIVYCKGGKYYNVYLRFHTLFFPYFQFTQERILNKNPIK